MSTDRELDMAAGCAVDPVAVGPGLAPLMDEDIEAVTLHRVEQATWRVVNSATLLTVKHVIRTHTEGLCHHPGSSIGRRGPLFAVLPDGGDPLGRRRPRRPL